MGIRTIFYKILNQVYKKNENMLVFIPHGGCYQDGYDFENYKSDNSLSFFHHVIEKYGNKHVYRIAVDYRSYIEQEKRITCAYPKIDVHCFPFFNYSHISRFRRLLLEHKNYVDVFVRAKYFFSSEDYPLFSIPHKTSEQVAIILGYFIPFKNDYNLEYLHHSCNAIDCIDGYITTSLLSSQIISHTYGIPLFKFRHLGFSRNDELMTLKNKLHDIRNEICSKVGYEANKIFLYTPTHRDYEKNETTLNRGLFGFDINTSELDSFLKTNKVAIVCKLHSAQVKNVINFNLPKGVVIYQGDGHYGLCELMQISDCLITDYTSAYFDYLLLDRPVLFGFYDFEKYKSCRGFSFDPLESILAGDIFVDSKGLFECMKKVLDGEDCWKDKRKFVRELIHKYRDTGSSERIYNYIVDCDAKAFVDK